MVKPKKGKKQWFKIVAPEIFNSVELGETPAYAPEQTIGRTLELNMPFINGDFSKNHVFLTFQIYDVKGETCYTKIKGYRLMEEYVRSLVRRRTSKIEAIKDVEFKDGKKARVKVVAITQHRANYNQRKAIRKRLWEILENIAKEYEFERFIIDLISGRIQNSIKKDLHKVFPMKFVEFRRVELQEKITQEGSS